MPESPISETPYELLGVAPTASDEDLRRAYRRLLRETHPDTGGDSERFVAVQKAWERIGTPEGREAYARGSSAGHSAPTWASASGTENRSRPADTRPRARSFGHPGGWRRERYLHLIREWAGRGADLADPYDPALVRSAPRDLRHILADALAEEATARTLSTLGIGYTVWHDVSTGDPENKIDHIVLGPTGLFALLSEDFGGPVGVKKGELIGEVVGESRPIHELGNRVKILSKSVRVRFSAIAIVLPDDALPEPIVELGSSRGATTIAVRLSYLPLLLRQGIPGTAPIGGNELFDVRTRLQGGIRFV